MLGPERLSDTGPVAVGRSVPAWLRGDAAAAGSAHPLDGPRHGRVLPAAATVDSSPGGEFLRNLGRENDRRRRLGAGPDHAAGRRIGLVG